MAVAGREVDRVPMAGPRAGAKPEAPLTLCFNNEAVPPDTLRFAAGLAGDDGGLRFSPAIVVVRANGSGIGLELGRGIPVLSFVGVGRGIALGGLC